MIGRRKFAVVGLCAVAALGTGWVMGGEHEHHERGEHVFRSHGDLRPVTDPRYQAECGSCHMAYPPGLLPARSWKAVMAGLSDHFGDNAALAPEAAQQIERYLTANAADSGVGGRGARIDRSIAPDATPLRITETAYFRRKHHELSPQAVAANPQVKSLSQCNACHPGAQQGNFSEHEVRIPGGGRRE